MAFLSTFSGRLVTTDYVLLEVANFYSRAAVRQAFLDLLATIRGTRTRR